MDEWNIKPHGLKFEQTMKIIGIKSAQHYPPVLIPLKENSQLIENMDSPNIGKTILPSYWQVSNTPSQLRRSIF